jgi:hypothetical protein
MSSGFLRRLLPFLGSVSRKQNTAQRNIVTTILLGRATLRDALFGVAARMQGKRKLQLLPSL